MSRLPTPFMGDDVGGIDARKGVNRMNYALLVKTEMAGLGLGYQDMALFGPYESEAAAEGATTAPHLVIALQDPGEVRDEWDREARDLQDIRGRQYDFSQQAVVALWGRGVSFDLAGPFPSLAAAKSFEDGLAWEDGAAGGVMAMETPAGLGDYLRD